MTPEQRNDWQKVRDALEYLAEYSNPLTCSVAKQALAICERNLKE